MLKIYIGWDSREPVAFDVCKSSIERRSSIPVEVIPIKQYELREQGIYTRSIDNLGATEFTFTRFFVPYLNNFSGKAIFCDCDFIWDCDAKEVLETFDGISAVQVAKHHYNPTELIKMDQKVQHQYPRKNWSSMIFWNCEHPSNMVLTPDFLNQAQGSTLHQFKWLCDSEIGEVSYKFNWLEGWYKQPKDGEPKIIHYTRGGPWFRDYQDVDFAKLWTEEFKYMTGKEWTADMILDK